MPKYYLNPPQLFDSRPYGFSQVVETSGNKTIYLSGQVAWDAEQELVGKGDLEEQASQALRNIELAVTAAGGYISDVVSLRIYILAERMTDSEAVSRALKAVFPESVAPATTWIGVSALAHPDFLIEIEAIAVTG